MDWAQYFATSIADGQRLIAEIHQQQVVRQAQSPWPQHPYGPPSWWKIGMSHCASPISLHRDNPDGVCQGQPLRATGKCTRHSKLAGDVWTPIEVERRRILTERSELAWAMRTRNPPAPWGAIAKAFGLKSSANDSAYHAFALACKRHGWGSGVSRYEYRGKAPSEAVMIEYWDRARIDLTDDERDAILANIREWQEFDRQRKNGLLTRDVLTESAVVTEILSPRVHNALKRHCKWELGGKQVEDFLSQASRADLLAVRNLGGQAMVEIEAVVGRRYT